MLTFQGSRVELYRSAFAENDSRPKAASSVDAARPPWKSILVECYREFGKIVYVGSIVQIRRYNGVTTKACFAL